MCEHEGIIFTISFVSNGLLFFRLFFCLIGILGAVARILALKYSHALSLSFLNSIKSIRVFINFRIKSSERYFWMEFVGKNGDKSHY